ncbi:hypothetical protein UA08_01301 [Talaromyces atroroseus]|uniref:Thioesterase domain-containing protein n=1 Tax=Talaromyces atroroseus TaxID=1441469 RepID=A0A1Q5QA14_TALAT|nr:hypothetical protein UA08_01301 [Talaromyces atroroseus]OKL62750.1 hypothetical protein UA08_01301 [Talaromyces atroroseus]
MNPFEANPALIQRGSPEGADTPLVLFHDGGGTIASYYCLGNFGRTVYGIHDPRFLVNLPWKGGLSEMARVYAELIRTIISPGENVILGGWSLGGLLALEVAHVLESESDSIQNSIGVVGIVMLDSPYTGPGPVTDSNFNILSNRPFLKSTCPPELALLITRSMRRAGQMVERWSVPSWTKKGVRPPPVILLRCMDMVPVSKKSSQEPLNSRENDIYSVDRYRARNLLGWEYLDQPDFIRAVLNIPGHHFNVMAEENVQTTTENLILACKMLSLGMYGR